MTQRSIGVAAICIGAFMALGIAMNVGEGFGAVAYLLSFASCSLLPIGVGVALLRGSGERRLTAPAEHAATA